MAKCKCSYGVTYSKQFYVDFKDENVRVNVDDIDFDYCPWCGVRLNWLHGEDIKKFRKHKEEK